MELETYCKAEQIYKELSYWRDCLFRIEEETRTGIVYINIGGQSIKIDAKELGEMSQSLQMTIKGKIKLLEQQFKEL